MVDVNEEVRELLELIPGINIYFLSPPEKSKLPAATYFESATAEGFRADSREWYQKSAAQIDVWATTPRETAELAILVNAVMQEGGWYRNISRDMGRDGKVYRKNMLFTKHLDCLKQ